MRSLVSSSFKVFEQILTHRTIPSCKYSNISTYDETKDCYKPLNDKSPVWSWNEWDPLEEIIVGTPEFATIPKLTPDVQACVTPNHWEFYRKNGGKLWSEAISNEHWKNIIKEIEDLADILRTEGVTVVRPKPFDFTKTFKTPTFESQGLYCAMPRDFVLVVGDEIIESTMTWRSRYFEYLCYKDLFIDYWKRGAKWTAAPKPECSERLFDFEFKEKVNKSSEKGPFVTSEFEPVFDAADFIRAGRDIFGQRSHVTNEAGIEWLRRHLAPKDIRVHQLEFEDARPMHIDATFVLVKPGCVLQNPDRPCRQIDLFKKADWDIIDVPQPFVPDNHPLWLGSKWLSMNTLMIDQNRVLVEKNEEGICQMFEKIGVTPIKHSMRHANSIGGGFHCWTADIRRKGNLESYF